MVKVTSSDFSIKRVILKGLLLFLIIDILFTVSTPLPHIAKISAYNEIFPGRPRLPYGEKPDQAYNLSLYSLEAMFASHVLSDGEKPGNEYRILLFGDSSIWGFLLKPENTLASYINKANLKINNKVVRAYNLGYPTMSLAKDLMILNYAMRYQPDMIIWLITLESMPTDRQLDSPIVQNNPENIRNLIEKYRLHLDVNDSRLVKSSFLKETLIGQRRNLADILRLQLYGILWASTGIDQYYPPNYEPPQSDFTEDVSFHNLYPPELKPEDLALDELSAGQQMADSIPIIFINEPIFISKGENSDIRYNFFYPRWAYDQYRLLLKELAQQNGWHYLDFWNLVPAREFTNSAIHMTPVGSQLLAVQLMQAIQSFH